MTGLKDGGLALSIITQGVKAIESFSSEEEGIIAITSTLKDMKPRDSFEARLIAQSTVLFEMAMKSCTRCGEASRLCHIEAMANLAIKLIRAQNETIDTLGRYRRGSEQKVSVTHAVMANQAIINNNFGEGVSPKNSGGTPCTQENAEQKLEPMKIDHAEISPCPMGGAVSMVEKALEQRVLKERNC